MACSVPGGMNTSDLCRDRDGAVVTEDHHTQCVSNEDEGDSDCVEDDGGGVVVGREHYEGPALLLEATKVRSRDGHVAS